MTLLHHALRAARGTRPEPARGQRSVLVVGAAGALGAAVLEQLLATQAFARVAVLVAQPLNTALRGLVALPEVALDAPGDDDTAVIVFDRERHANGREQAFVRPQPQALPALAAALHRRGVRSLVVVLPHAPASLPEALKRGLANLDEHAVASLGFEHLVFMRSAQAPPAVGAGHVLHGLAQWVLAQLQLMIPAREKPVRAQKIAQLAAQLALQLPHAPAGTRVVPPELLWQAAQQHDVGAFARDWLHDRPMAAVQPATMRL